MTRFGQAALIPAPPIKGIIVVYDGPLPGRLTTPKSLGVTVRMRDCDTAGLTGVLDARRLWLGLAGLLALLAFEPATAREPVSLVTVESRQLEERLPLTGTLTAKRSALLSTSVSGLVTALNGVLGIFRPNATFRLLSD